MLPAATHRHLDRVAPEPLDHLHARGEDGRRPEDDQPPAWAAGRDRFAGHPELGHGGVEGGRRAAGEEQDVAGVDRPSRRVLTVEDDHPEGGVGGQHGDHRYPEQPVGRRALAASAPEPDQDCQEDHVGQGQHDRGELLVQRQRRVAGVGEHQELPRHHPQPGGHHQRVQQRRHVAAPAAGAHQPQQGDRQGEVGGEEADVGEITHRAGELDGVAGAEGQQGGSDQVPGPRVDGPVKPDTDHHGDGRTVVQERRRGGDNPHGVGKQVVPGRGHEADGQEASPDGDPHELLCRQLSNAT